MSGTVGPRLSTIPPTFFNDYSFEFDGTDDFVVSVPTLMGAYNTAIIRSFSFWVKINSGTYVPFFCGKNGGAAPFPRYSCGSGIVLGRLQWALDYYRASSAYCRAYSELIDGTGDPTKNILDGNWHHIAIYNPVDSTANRANIVNCKMWLDGQPLTVLNDGAPYGTNAVRGLGSALQIGVGSTGSHSGQDYLNGNIDEFSYFDNYELTNDDVTAIYNSGSPTNLSDLTTPPTSWYRNGDNGTWQQPQWLIPSNENKDKVSNYSFDFDGTDDYIDVGVISALDNVTTATWSIWANSSITSSYHYLMSCYSAGFKQYLFKQSTNKIDIFLSDSSGTLRLMNTSNFTFTAGVWFHIAMVYDETEVSDADKLKVYIDGLLQTNTVSGFALTSLYTSKGNSTEIGKAGGFTTNEFLGNLDEIAIFTTAKTQSDITDIFNLGNPTDLTSLNPIAYYKMGENATFSTNWTVPDQIGSNDGTSANMDINNRIGDAPGSENNALSYNMVLSGRTSDVPT